MTQPLLSIENLSIRFGHTRVVDDVSLAVNPGEIVALVGESGSGKSLTAQSILQLLPPEAAVSGAITFDGKRIDNATPAAIRALRGNHVGMIFQEPQSALNPLHDVRRQIIEPFCWHQKLSRHSAEAKTKLLELLAAVGLDHLAHRGTLYPHQLSGGERQRAMIAMAIANDPALLIADEPTTALDVTLQVQILELLQTLQRERGMAMLFISHDLGVVRRIATRVAVMQHGKLVEQGPIALLNAPQHSYTRLLVDAAPRGHAVPLPAAAAEILRTEKLNVHFPITTPLLRRTVGFVRAANDVSLSLHAGETLGIVGESGSGKTSLANAILRLVKSDGPIVFLGRRLNQLQGQALRAERRNFQPVFQDPFSSLNPRLTVGELISEGLMLHGLIPSPLGGGLGRGREEAQPMPHSVPLLSSPLQGEACPASPLAINAAVDAILTQVGLSPEMKDRYPHAFSGGQRQRIAIARAMVLRPKLVVLDEPTSALDMSVQSTVLELLKTLQASHHCAYLFISHDLRVIRAVAHQVLVMQHGDVVEQGATEQIFNAPQQNYTKVLLAAAQISHPQ
ncbi:MAG: ABC transporter ATP-binding protein [Rickettsiales bacterium]